MRTGLKILTKSILNQLSDPTYLYNNIKDNEFPQKHTNPIRIKARLQGLTSELKNRKLHLNFGSLNTPPHPICIKIYQDFIKFNPGNLGNWSNNISDTYSTTRMEHEVIHKIIDIYSGNHKRMNGYITSGGTEGNIYLMWLGRTSLEKVYENNQICLLRTSLTHYSIEKAGKISGLKQFVLPLNEIEWGIDTNGFSQSISKLYKKGYKGFIVPLTIGYTSTGTSDNVNDILQLATKLMNKLENIKFFFWIDASLNGLIEPFVDNTFKPFSSKLVQGIVVDFHKLGLVPYSAGVVIYNKVLNKLTRNNIPYLSEIDDTLLGSRSGIPAICIWAMIHSFGKEGYKKLILKQLEHKEFFLKEMSLYPQIKVVTNSNSLTCGMIYTGNTSNQFPKWLEQKYYLYPGLFEMIFYPNIKVKIKIYKIFFLPHITKLITKEFCKDIKYCLIN